MPKKITVESLVEDLRSLAGISSTVSSMVDEEVDWLIPTENMDDNAHALLLRMGGRSQGVTEEKKIDASVRETVKGALEILAKRMEGIGDLVDMGKLSSVQTALGKVIKDAQTLFDSVTTGDKKAKELAKKDGQKAQDPQEPKSQEEKGDKGGKPTAKERAQAPAQGGASRGAAQQAAAPKGGAGEQAVQRTQESVIIVGAEAITESQMRDPFGLGDAFKQEIVRMATAKKKPVEEG